MSWIYKRIYKKYESRVTLSWINFIFKVFLVKETRLHKWHTLCWSPLRTWDKLHNKVPIYLFLVSHQVLPLHTMRAGITIIQPTGTSHKRSWQSWWQYDCCSLSVIVHGFFWMLYTRQSFLLSLCSSLCSWHLSLVCLTSLICANKNNGDKFYHRKSMRAGA